MISLNFVTSNSGKVASLRRALDDVGLKDIAIKAQELDIIEPQADTCEEVGRSKARQAYEILLGPLLVDDSSFHISALGGFPGVYVKYMIGKLGAEGIIEFMKGKSDRSAYFDGVLIYVDQTGEQHVFQEVPLWGEITTRVHTMDEKRSWSDLHKIFIPKGSSKVLGEMTPADYAQQTTNNRKYQNFAKWLQPRQQED